MVSKLNPMVRVQRYAFFLLLILLFFTTSGNPSQDLGTRRDWPIYGGDAGAIRYSSLSQINRDNVSQLQTAWTFETGDAFPGSQLECSPLAIDGVLYLTSPKQRVFALNAATGKVLWTFDPNGGHRALGDTRTRSVTYWVRGNDERIIVSAQQFLYSLDAKTGKPITSFGDNGRVDLRDGLGHEREHLSVLMTSPGVVYGDLLIVGSTVSESLPAYPGDIRAYDVPTGKMRWIFHTIPHPGEFGYETWPKDAWKYGGAANAWSGMSVDVKRGLVFVPLGSASSDYYGGDRIGDDLFANSLVVLHAKTGKRVWHFQTVRHDIWDRDLGSQPALVVVQRNGKNVDAVAQTTKSGFVFLFDRETGKPLFPIQYHKYPASDIPGEKTASTQPLPLLPPPFARQILTESMLTNRTPEAHAAVLERFKTLRSGGQFIPESLQGTVVLPGLVGGAGWGGPAFDPKTGLLYVNETEMAWIVRIVKRLPDPKTMSGKTIYERNCAPCHNAYRTGNPPEIPSLVNISQKYNSSELATIVMSGTGRMPSFSLLAGPKADALIEYLTTGKDEPVESLKADPPHLPYELGKYEKFLDPDGYPAVAPPWGTLNAIDLNRGKIVWKIPFGEYPELAEKGHINTGSENQGGPVVTDGGLVFIGATSYDRKFHAFDKTTGKLLWETVLPSAGNATPVVYEVHGREFVVIAAGGGKSKHPSGGSYLAFALPKTGGRP
jgi:quinoprotein glucose dehydrogenase